MNNERCICAMAQGPVSNCPMHSKGIAAQLETIDRLTRERDAVELLLKRAHVERATAVQERDDARRVAKVLATSTCAYFNREPRDSAAWKAAEETALAYPEAIAAHDTAPKCARCGRPAGSYLHTSEHEPWRHDFEAP